MSKKAIVAGHICLDITPSFYDRGAEKIKDILSPGKLVNVGAPDIHTGGAVANTGLAMKKLGADVMLVAKIGDDEFGKIVSSIAGRYDAAGSLIVSKGDVTSYSVVLAIPGIDRIFLHDPGANDTFCLEDIPFDAVNEAALFHFGYPPLMKKMYENNGEQLIKMMRLVKAAGCATSLDMAATDPNTEAGKTDWLSVLSEALPYVDIFVPSIEELMFMLDRDRYEEIGKRCIGSDFTEVLDVENDIIPLGRECLDMGAKIVLLKCGAPGMYYITAGRDALEKVGNRLDLDAASWADKSGFMRSYKPDRILSGTGAGDTSIAAFLTAMLKGCGPEECVRYAVCEGACCVSGYDALSGLKSFEEIDKKLSAGWEQTDFR